MVPTICASASVTISFQTCEFVRALTTVNEITPFLRCCAGVGSSKYLVRSWLENLVATAVAGTVVNALDIHQAADSIEQGRALQLESCCDWFPKGPLIGARSTSKSPNRSTYCHW